MKTHIKPRKTKFPFDLIMEFSFWLSKIIKKKANNQKILEDYNKWPKTDEELGLFFNKWTYNYDPAHGLMNMVVHPKQSLLLAEGDCDDYAAKLYALCPYDEKYILTYFTHNLKKWHTVFVWYNPQTGNYNCINWWRRHTSPHFYEILDELKKYSESPWYDYHLAYFDKGKDKWVSYYK